MQHPQFPQQPFPPSYQPQPQSQSPYPRQYPPNLPPQGYPTQHQPSHPHSVMMPSDLASIAQQGYAQQQQQLAALSRAGGGGGMGMMGGPGGYATGGPGMAGTGGPSSLKKKKPKQTPTSQLLPRQSLPYQTQPQPSDTYLKQALLETGPNEPWADALDEVDPREMAMGRFRARQEVLGEIFGGERIKDIPLSTRDPWEGLGMDGETLEAKVTALEKENETMEGKLESELEDWKKSLGEIDSGRDTGES